MAYLQGRFAYDPSAAHAHQGAYNSPAFAGTSHLAVKGYANTPIPMYIQPALPSLPPPRVVFRLAGSGNIPTLHQAILDIKQIQLQPQDASVIYQFKEILLHINWPGYKPHETWMRTIDVNGTGQRYTLEGILHIVAYEYRYFFQGTGDSKAKRNGSKPVFIRPKTDGELRNFGMDALRQVYPGRNIFELDLIGGEYEQ
ncbi:hypothetical protein C8Q77DRAFT_1158065 [Trametes polyzona]|nr:hypothetical protein C8Q77DRAFT_1158065 [Trametes polyzona]